MSSQLFGIGSILGQQNVFPIAAPGPRFPRSEGLKLPVHGLEGGIEGLRQSEQELRKPVVSLKWLDEQQIASLQSHNQVVENEFGVFVPKTIFGSNVDIRHELGRMADGNVSVLICGVSRRGHRRRTLGRIDCREDQQWLEQHRVEFAGEWVALHGGRLLSHGEDSRTVYEAARRLGIAAPLLVKVQPRDELPFGGW